MRHMTLDYWHMVGGEKSLNISSLASTVWEWRFFEDLEEKDDWASWLVSKWITNLFVEQPPLHRGC